MPVRASAATLPGGLPFDGALARGYAFAPMDGHLELALVDAVGGAASTPDAVTRVLSRALASLAGAAPDPGRVAALCVADRQHLMRALEVHLALRCDWASATCGQCKARFDMRIDVDLPVKPAGAGFPLADVACEGRAWRVRVPDGGDQAWIAARGADADTPRELAARLVREVDGEAVDGVDAASITDALLDAIDAALEDCAPATTTTVSASCPECGHANAVALDPYGALACSRSDVLDTVHRLASHYHWSERDILALPRARRREYLQRVDAELGLAV